MIAAAPLLIANSNPIHDHWIARLCADTGADLVTTPAELEQACARKDYRYVFFPHWSSIIPAKIYETVECVLYHMTDLPYGRGGSPLQNLIVRGKTETQLSSLRVSRGLDTGPVYGKRPLSLHGTAREIFLRAGAVMDDFIRWHLREQPVPEPQLGEPVLFARRKPEDGRMNDLPTLEAVYDFIRMLDADGYPPAFMEIGAFRLEFTRASRGAEQLLADVRITRK